MENSNIATLRAIVNDILSPKNSYGKLHAACNKLYQFFVSITGLNPFDLNYYCHLETKRGLAVNWYSAAFCIIDFMRTARFIQSVEAAIKDRLSENKNKPVILLYAGTGPFATLALPLITRFSPSQLQFVFIELNSTTYEYLQKAITELDASSYIRRMFNEDASQFEIPIDCQPDILLSETMKPALDKEPQVSLVAHLIKQCREDVLMIPQCIHVNLLYRGNPLKDIDTYFPVKELLALDAILLRKIGSGEEVPLLFTSGERIDLPNFPDNSYDRVELFTQIQLYRDIQLDYNESSLTIAYVFDPPTRLTAPGSYNVQYLMNEKPGFVFTRIL